MSSNTNSTESSTDLPTSQTLPKPTPETGYIFKAEPDGDIEDACLGTVARFHEGTVVTHIYDFGLASHESTDEALSTTEASFPDADVWFDWDT